jgi:hypothetical protein
MASEPLRAWERTRFIPLGWTIVHSAISQVIDSVACRVLGPTGRRFWLLKLIVTQ